jgi:hypothetical protein
MKSRPCYSFVFKAGAFEFDELPQVEQFPVLQPLEQFEWAGEE